MLDDASLLRKAADVGQEGLAMVAPWERVDFDEAEASSDSLTPLPPSSTAGCVSHQGEPDGSPLLYSTDLAQQEQDLTMAGSGHGDCTRCNGMLWAFLSPCGSTKSTRARVVCAHACHQGVRVVASPCYSPVRER
jgi:hypothetical protein